MATSRHYALVMAVCLLGGCAGLGQRHAARTANRCGASGPATCGCQDHCNSAHGSTALPATRSQESCNCQCHSGNSGQSCKTAKCRPKVFEKARAGLHCMGARMDAAAGKNTAGQHDPALAVGTQDHSRYHPVPTRPVFEPIEGGWAESRAPLPPGTPPPTVPAPPQPLSRSDRQDDRPSWVFTPAAATPYQPVPRLEPVLEAQTSNNLRAMRR